MTQNEEEWQKQKARMQAELIASCKNDDNRIPMLQAKVERLELLVHGLLGVITVGSQLLQVSNELADEIGITHVLTWEHLHDRYKRFAGDGIAE